MYSTGRIPKFSTQNSSSSRVSATCVCRSTPRSLAWAADSRIRFGVTEKGEQGAMTTDLMEPGLGSWNWATALALSSKMCCSSSSTESGGNPPSDSPRLIDPREAANRIFNPSAPSNWSSILEPLGQRYWWSKTVVAPVSAISTKPNRVATRTWSGVIRAHIGYNVCNHGKSPTF